MSTRTIPLAGLGACAFLLASDSASTLILLRLGICGATLAALSATDLAEHRIPNRLVLPAALACAALSAADGAGVEDLLAAGAVVVLLGLVSFVWPAALGMGDVKLALLVLAGLDGNAWRAIAIGVLLAALAGLILIAWEGSSARRRSLPLAPFVTAGALLAVLA